MRATCAASCCALIALCGACNVYSDALLGGAPNGAGGSSAGAKGNGGGAISVAEAGEGGEVTSPSGGMAEMGGAGTNPEAGSSQGGSSGAGTVAGFSNGGGATVVNPDTIDDLEDNDKTTLVFNNPRRDGIWDTGQRDATGQQVPEQFMFLPKALSAAEAPYANDKYAAYTKGNGFTTSGAYMNVSMRSWADYANTPQYDASKYTGLSFLAKVGASSTKAMRVRFISGDTDPRGKKCKTVGMQSELCYNHYFSVVTLSNTWQKYELSFADDFAQGGDGMTNDAINLKGMYGLEFYFNPSNDFELWLDDLTFTK